MTTRDAVVEVSGWPTDRQESWSERAALIEDGCSRTPPIGHEGPTLDFPREEAERMALEQLRPRAPLRQASLFERALMKAQGG